jgi:acyl-CoA thioesterase
MRIYVIAYSYSSQEKKYFFGQQREEVCIIYSIMNINNNKEVKGRQVTMAQAYDNFLKAMNGGTSFTTIDRCGKDSKNIFCIQACNDSKKKK